MIFFKKYIFMPVLILSFCFCGVFNSSIMAANTKSPMDVVKDASNNFFKIIGDQQESPDQATIRKKLAELAEELFDYRKISALVLGRNVRKFTTKEFDEFVTLFSKILEKTYISRIENYFNEKVVFERELMLSPNKAQVETKIVQNGKEIPVSYRLFLSSHGWKGYDVLIEGVSLVKNYRTQFQTILSKDKPSDLIKQLKTKTSST